eukprot:1181874-Prorocentrum_minimum.AAC.1
MQACQQVCGDKTIDTFRRGPIAEGNGAYSPRGDQLQRGTGHIHHGGTNCRRERGIFTTGGPIAEGNRAYGSFDGLVVRI